MSRSHRELPDRRRGGASAIEFAFVLPFFFMLIYTIVSYGLLFALQQSLSSAASDAARAAVACDPEMRRNDPQGYELCVLDRARETAGVALEWMGDGLRSRILGDGNSNVQVQQQASSVGEGTTVEVILEYPDLAADPILPTVTLPLVGTFPPLPARLAARSVVAL